MFPVLGPVEIFSANMPRLFGRGKEEQWTTHPVSGPARVRSLGPEHDSVHENHFPLLAFGFKMMIVYHMWTPRGSEDIIVPISVLSGQQEQKRRSRTTQIISDQEIEYTNRWR